MSMASIRKYYGVPAKRGARVTYNGQPGTITGSAGQYLRVKLDDEKHTLTCHPTWQINYDYKEEPA